MLLHFLRSILSDKLNVEDRDPVISVGPYSLLVPKWKFFVQNLVVMCLVEIFSVALAMIVYKLIVKRKRSMFSYIAGYMLVIPACFLYPYWCIDWFQIGNKVQRVILGAATGLNAFKVTAAMFGFIPSGAETSFENFRLYFALPVEVVFDPKTKQPAKCTKSEARFNLKHSIISLWEVAAIVSFLKHCDYEPFKLHSEESGNTMFGYFLDPGHLCNCFLYALNMQMFLEHYSYVGCTIVNYRYGLKAVHTIQNPMFSSSSPSDFWGKRWNVYVHSVLKRGVYKPIRKFSSRTIALILTFLASGLFHEYHITLIHHILASEKDDRGICSSCYYPKYGENTAFFLWNGAIIALEMTLRRYTVVHSLMKMIPNSILHLLVVMLSLPVAHWICNAYVLSDYPTYYHVAMPLVVKSN